MRLRLPLNNMSQLPRRSGERGHRNPAQESGNDQANRKDLQLQEVPPVIDRPVAEGQKIMAINGRWPAN